MADKQVVQVLDGFDNKAQADRIAALIMPGETLYLVFDCKGRGSGFIGVTDKRIIARDDGHRNKSIVSIPYSRIHAVGVDANASWRGGSSFLSFSAGDDEWAFNFKGADKARRAYQRIMENLLDIERAPASAPVSAEAE